MLLISSLPYDFLFLRELTTLKISSWLVGLKNKEKLHLSPQGGRPLERGQDQDRFRKQLCHFGILSADKCRNHCSLCIDCRSVLGSNPEGIRTGCGQVQDMRTGCGNECGFTKLDSASCQRPSGADKMRTRCGQDAESNYVCAATCPHFLNNVRRPVLIPSGLLPRTLLHNTKGTMIPTLSCPRTECRNDIICFRNPS